ncbi:metallophosphoesterase family protein [Allochromatium tepidum]|uniref:Metallophosphoesterase n=1 Tax=Allochromatium tepidum TaxID=553982 RepID=A0ABM7QQY4_9GAMM|nr:DNA repair exonuclease [Allochromatium tepidum]BCU08106.1 metallophosphoesterase [Allochromatium tepidum]
MKFIHAADIHLDSPLRGLERYEGAPVEALRGATRRALESLVDLALDEAVTAVLLAGDLYDGDWKDYNTGLFFARQMERLRAADIPVFAVTGNHDAVSQITRRLRLPANVHLFATRAPETQVREDLGFAVHGQGFASRAVSEDLTRAYPAPCSGLFNIGLLHTSLDGRPDHDTYAPCSRDGLRTLGYDYWALGHVHRHEIVDESPWIVFPGNLQGRHARETGPKGCCLVEVEDERVQRVELRALDVARWFDCRVDLSAVASLEEVYARAEQRLSAALESADGRLAAVRLRFAGVCAVHSRLQAVQDHVINDCRALANALGGEAMWLEKVLIETRREPSAAERLIRDEAFGSLLSVIRDLELDDERLERLSAEFSDLAAKLPPEIRRGDEPCDPGSPAFLRHSLAEAQELLLARLLDPGEP